MLGGIVAATITTAKPETPAYSAALVVQLVAQPGGGGGGTADMYPGATLQTYGASGSLSATLGTLPTLQKDVYDTLVVNPGNLQLGMPALLTASGYNSESMYTGFDLFQITPGTADSLIRVTNTNQ